MPEDTLDFLVSLAKIARTVVPSAARASLDECVALLARFYCNSFTVGVSGDLVDSRYTVMRTIFRVDRPSGLERLINLRGENEAGS